MLWQHQKNTACSVKESEYHTEFVAAKKLVDAGSIRAWLATVVTLHSQTQCSNSSLDFNSPQQAMKLTMRTVLQCTECAEQEVAHAWKYPHKWTLKNVKSTVTCEQKKYLSGDAVLFQISTDVISFQLHNSPQTLVIQSTSLVDTGDASLQQMSLAWMQW